MGAKASVLSAINERCGGFCEPVTSSQADVTVVLARVRISLTSLRLKPDALSTLFGLPFRVDGVLDNIRIEFNLLGLKTEPTVVKVGSIALIFMPWFEGRSPEALAQEEAARKARLLRGVESLLRASARGSSSSEPAPPPSPDVVRLVEGLLGSVIANLRLEVAGLHIRYEHILRSVILPDGTRSVHSAVAGIRVGRIELVTADKKWSAVRAAVEPPKMGGVVFKKLHAEHLALYVDSRVHALSSAPPAAGPVKGTPATALSARKGGAGCAEQQRSARLMSPPGPKAPSRSALRHAAAATDYALSGESSGRGHTVSFMLRPCNATACIAIPLSAAATLFSVMTPSPGRPDRVADVQLSDLSTVTDGFEPRQPIEVSFTVSDATLGISDAQLALLLRISDDLWTWWEAQQAGVLMRSPAGLIAGLAHPLHTPLAPRAQPVADDEPCADCGGRRLCFCELSKKQRQRWRERGAAALQALARCYGALKRERARHKYIAECSQRYAFLHLRRLRLAPEAFPACAAPLLAAEREEYTTIERNALLSAHDVLVLRWAAESLLRSHLRSPPIDVATLRDAELQNDAAASQSAARHTEHGSNVITVSSTKPPLGGAAMQKPLTGVQRVFSAMFRRRANESNPPTSSQVPDVLSPTADGLCLELTDEELRLFAAQLELTYDPGLSGDLGTFAASCRKDASSGGAGQSNNTGQSGIEARSAEIRSGAGLSLTAPLPATFAWLRLRFAAPNGASLVLLRQVCTPQVHPAGSLGNGGLASVGVLSPIIALHVGPSLFGYSFRNGGGRVIGFDLGDITLVDCVVVAAHAAAREPAPPPAARIRAALANETAYPLFSAQSSQQYSEMPSKASASCTGGLGPDDSALEAVDEASLCSEPHRTSDVSEYIPFVLSPAPSSTGWVSLRLERSTSNSSSSRACAAFRLRLIVRPLVAMWSPSCVRRALSWATAVSDPHTVDTLFLAPSSDGAACKPWAFPAAATGFDGVSHVNSVRLLLQQLVGASIDRHDPRAAVSQALREAKDQIDLRVFIAGPVLVLPQTVRVTRHDDEESGENQCHLNRLRLVVDLGSFSAATRRHGGYMLPMPTLPLMSAVASKAGALPWSSPLSDDCIPPGARGLETAAQRELDIIRDAQRSSAASSHERVVVAVTGLRVTLYRDPTGPTPHLDESAGNLPRKEVVSLYAGSGASRAAVAAAAACSSAFPGATAVDTALVAIGHPIVSFSPRLGRPLLERCAVAADILVPKDAIATDALPGTLEPRLGSPIVTCVRVGDVTASLSTADVADMHVLALSAVHGLVTYERLMAAAQWLSRGVEPSGSGHYNVGAVTHRLMRYPFSAAVFVLPPFRRAPATIHALSTTERPRTLSTSMIELADVPMLLASSSWALEGARGPRNPVLIRSVGADVARVPAVASLQSAQPWAVVCASTGTLSLRLVISDSLTIQHANPHNNRPRHHPKLHQKAGEGISLSSLFDLHFQNCGGHAIGSVGSMGVEFTASSGPSEVSAGAPGQARLSVKVAVSLRGALGKDDGAVLQPAYGAFQVSGTCSELILFPPKRPVSPVVLCTPICVRVTVQLPPRTAPQTDVHVGRAAVAINPSDVALLAQFASTGVVGGRAAAAVLSEAWKQLSSDFVAFQPDAENGDAEDDADAVCAEWDRFFCAIPPSCPDLLAIVLRLGGRMESDTATDSLPWGPLAREAGLGRFVQRRIRRLAARMGSPSSAVAASADHIIARVSETSVGNRESSLSDGFATRAVVRCDGVEIVLLGDSTGFLRHSTERAEGGPLNRRVATQILRLRVAGIDLRLRAGADAATLRARTALSFFNGPIVAWEPVFDPWATCISFRISSNEAVSTESFSVAAAFLGGVEIECASESPLNITLSAGLVSSIPAISAALADISEASKLRRVLSDDAAVVCPEAESDNALSSGASSSYSPFVVINETGCLLQVWPANLGVISGRSSIYNAQPVPPTVVAPGGAVPITAAALGLLQHRIASSAAPDALSGRCEQNRMETSCASEWDEGLVEEAISASVSVHVNLQIEGCQVINRVVVNRPGATVFALDLLPPGFPVEDRGTPLIPHPGHSNAPQQSSSQLHASPIEHWRTGLCGAWPEAPPSPPFGFIEVRVESTQGGGKAVHVRSLVTIENNTQAPLAVRLAPRFFSSPLLSAFALIPGVAAESSYSHHPEDVDAAILALLRHEAAAADATSSSAATLSHRACQEFPSFRTYPVLHSRAAAFGVGLCPTHDKIGAVRSTQDGWHYWDIPYLAAALGGLPLERVLLPGRTWRLPVAFSTHCDVYVRPIVEVDASLGQSVKPLQSVDRADGSVRLWAPPLISFTGVAQTKRSDSDVQYAPDPAFSWSIFEGARAQWTTSSQRRGAGHAIASACSLPNLVASALDTAKSEPVRYAGKVHDAERRVDVGAVGICLRSSSSSSSLDALNSAALSIAAVEVDIAVRLTRVSNASLRAASLGHALAATAKLALSLRAPAELTNSLPCVAEFELGVAVAVLRRADAIAAQADAIRQAAFHAAATDFLRTAKGGIFQRAAAQDIIDAAATAVAAAEQTSRNAASTSAAAAMVADAAVLIAEVIPVCAGTLKPGATASLFHAYPNACAASLRGTPAPYSALRTDAARHARALCVRFKLPSLPLEWGPWSHVWVPGAVHKTQASELRGAVEASAAFAAAAAMLVPLPDSSLPPLSSWSNGPSPLAASSRTIAVPDSRGQIATLQLDRAVSSPVRMEASDATLPSLLLYLRCPLWLCNSTGLPLLFSEGLRSRQTPAAYSGTLTRSAAQSACKVIESSVEYEVRRASPPLLPPAKPVAWSFLASGRRSIGGETDAQPTAPAQWETSSGGSGDSGSKPFPGVRPLSSVQLPAPSCEWTSPWAVDCSGGDTDSEGWQYHQVPPLAAETGWLAKDYPAAQWRRRRWVRSWRRRVESIAQLCGLLPLEAGSEHVCFCVGDAPWSKPLPLPYVTPSLGSTDSPSFVYFSVAGCRVRCPFAREGWVQPRYDLVFATRFCADASELAAIVESSTTPLHLEVHSSGRLSGDEHKSAQQQHAVCISPRFVLANRLPAVAEHSSCNAISGAGYFLQVAPAAMASRQTVDAATALGLSETIQRYLSTDDRAATGKDAQRHVDAPPRLTAPWHAAPPLVATLSPGSQAPLYRPLGGECSASDSDSYRVCFRVVRASSSTSTPGSTAFAAESQTPECLVPITEWSGIVELDTYDSRNAAFELPLRLRRFISDDYRSERHDGSTGPMLTDNSTDLDCDSTSNEVVLRVSSGLQAASGSVLVVVTADYGLDSQTPSQKSDVGNVLAAAPCPSRAVREQQAKRTTNPSPANPLFRIDNHTAEAFFAAQHGAGSSHSRPLRVPPYASVICGWNEPTLSAAAGSSGRSDPWAPLLLSIRRTEHGTTGGSSEGAETELQAAFVSARALAVTHERAAALTAAAPRSMELLLSPPANACGSGCRVNGNTSDKFAAKPALQYGTLVYLALPSSPNVLATLGQSALRAEAAAVPGSQDVQNVVSSLHVTPMTQPVRFLPVFRAAHAAVVDTTGLSAESEVRFGDVVRICSDVRLPVSQADEQAAAVEAAIAARAASGEDDERSGSRLRHRRRWLAPLLLRGTWTAPTPALCVAAPARARLHLVSASDGALAWQIERDALAIPIRVGQPRAVASTDGSSLAQAALATAWAALVPVCSTFVIVGGPIGVAVSLSHLQQELHSQTMHHSVGRGGFGLVPVAYPDLLVGTHCTAGYKKDQISQQHPMHPETPAPPVASAASAAASTAASTDVGTGPRRRPAARAALGTQARTNPDTPLPLPPLSHGWRRRLDVEAIEEHALAAAARRVSGVLLCAVSGSPAQAPDENARPAGFFDGLGGSERGVPAPLSLWPAHHVSEQPEFPASTATYRNSAGSSGDGAGGARDCVPEAAIFSAEPHLTSSGPRGAAPLSRASRRALLRLVQASVGSTQLSSCTLLCVVPLSEISLPRRRVEATLGFDGQTRVLALTSSPAGVPAAVATPKSEPLLPLNSRALQLFRRVLAAVPFRVAASLPCVRISIVDSAAEELLLVTAEGAEAAFESQWPFSWAEATVQELQVDNMMANAVQGVALAASSSAAQQQQAEPQVRASKPPILLLRATHVAHRQTSSNGGPGVLHLPLVAVELPQPFTLAVDDCLLLRLARLALTADAAAADIASQRFAASLAAASRLDANHSSSSRRTGRTAAAAAAVEAALSAPACWWHVGILPEAAFFPPRPLPRILIQELRLPDITARFSLQLCRVSAASERVLPLLDAAAVAASPLAKVLATAAWYYPTVSNTSISMTGTTLRGLLAGGGEVRGHILRHYTSLDYTSLASAALVFSAAASLDAVGNPAAALGAIHDGVRGFISLPVQGLWGGPLSFGVGVGRGASSLLGGVFTALGTVVGRFADAVERRVAPAEDTTQAATAAGVLYGDADTIIDYSPSDASHPMAAAQLLATSPSSSFASPLRLGGAAAAAGLTGLRTVAYGTAHVVRRAADLVALSGRILQAATHGDGTPLRAATRLRWGIDRRLLPQAGWDGQDRTAPGGEHALLIAALVMALCRSGSSAPREQLAAATATAALSYMHHVLLPRFRARTVADAGHGREVLDFELEAEGAAVQGVGVPLPPSFMLIVSTRVIVFLPWGQAEPRVGSTMSVSSAATPGGKDTPMTPLPALNLAVPPISDALSLRTPQVARSPATPGPTGGTPTAPSSSFGQWWGLPTLTEESLHAAQRSALDPRAETAAAAAAGPSITGGGRGGTAVAVSAAAARVRRAAAAASLRRTGGSPAQHAGARHAVVTRGLLAGHLAWAHVLDAAAELVADFDELAQGQQLQGGQQGAGVGRPEEGSGSWVSPLGSPTDTEPTVRLMRLDALVSLGLRRMLEGQSSAGGGSAAAAEGDTGSLPAGAFGRLPPKLERCAVLETLPPATRGEPVGAAAATLLVALRPDSPPDANAALLRAAVDAITAGYARWCAGRRAWLEETSAAAATAGGGAEAAATAEPPHTPTFPAALAAELEKLRGDAGAVLTVDEYEPAVEHCVRLAGAELARQAPLLAVALAGAWLRHSGADLGADAPPVLYFRGALLRAALATL